MRNSTIHQPSQNWYLFLDRDGVINQRPHMDYVKSIDEFIFLPGVLAALKILSVSFFRIFIVTNQQGVGKDLMTLAQLSNIHAWMLTQIRANEGKIDHIFTCTDLNEKPDNCRKPGITMALQAKKMFPEIDFSRSIMVGDTESDIAFGKNAGMKTVLVGHETLKIAPDKKHQDLLQFALNYTEEGGWYEA